MLKRLAIIALLCVPFVGAKSFTFTLANKTQVGTAQLKPGEYTVSVKGSEAVLTDYYGHETKTPVKVEAADSTYPETSVVCTTSNGVDRIEYIGLKGSKEKVVLNQ
jgi:hypothetical protein